MDLGFDARRVLVIGASSGIGFSAARQISLEGADVIIASRDKAKLEAAGNEIAVASGRAPLISTVDLTKTNEADRLAEEVLARWNSLDALIVSVGGSVRSPFEVLSDEDWIANYTFNILSSVRAVRSMLTLLKAGSSPAVVLLGSAAARSPHAQQIMSNVHKAGLLSFVKTLAVEFAPFGIRVNSVGPGRTLTSLWTTRAEKMAAERGVTPDEIIAEFAHEIPLGRFADPDEVATMVTWLASPRAGYITGQSINVDGGMARGLL